MIYLNLLSFKTLFIRTLMRQYRNQMLTAKSYFAAYVNVTLGKKLEFIEGKVKRPL